MSYSVSIPMDNRSELLALFTNEIPMPDNMFVCYPPTAVAEIIVPVWCRRQVTLSLPCLHVSYIAKRLVVWAGDQTSQNVKCIFHDNDFRYDLTKV